MMIICMNYTTSGDRYISKMIYNCTYNRETLMNLAHEYAAISDEVYVMDFNNNCKELIDDVVLRGCRI